MNLEGGKSAKSGPGSQIGAVCFCDREKKANHYFNICSKAPFGSHIRCCNKFRRIGEHQNIQEESMNLEGGKSAKSGPGSQIGAVFFCDREKKAHHSFNICSKAPFGSQIQCCNKFRRIGGHQNIQEESTCLEGGKSAKSGPGSQIGLFVAVKGKKRHIIPTLHSQRLHLGPI